MSTFAICEPRSIDPSVATRSRRSAVWDTASEMMPTSRLPIRTRLTFAFAAGMAFILTCVGVFVYIRMGAALLETYDAGLRSRAEVLTAEVLASGPQLPGIGASLIESDESFAQTADASGRIVQSSQIVAASPLLDPAT